MKTLRAGAAVIFLATTGCSGARGAVTSGETHAVATAESAPTAPTAPTAQAKFAGNITTRNAVHDGFASYWQQITPENEGKWASVQPAEGVFDWTALDAIYAYAETHGLVFKQHTFLWGSRQPGWVTSANAETAVRAWMNAFCTRYPHTKLIDVVNEPPPHSTPVYIDGIGGAGATGYDWIVNAFKWARAACPDATLILNDFGIVENADANAHFRDVLRRIRGAGAPVDAIGAQAHDAFKLPASAILGYIDELANTGLPVYITEYDIPLTDDIQQLMVMQSQFPAFWNHPRVHGVTMWGYIVGATYQEGAGLQQADGKMRPAMTWLMKFLGRASSTASARH